MSFDPVGYACGALSNVAQATYLILVQRATNGKLSSVESLQLNSINTLPFLILLTVLKGEISDMRSYDQFHSVSFYVVFFLAISCGCLLNYSLFLCTMMTSAITTSVVGGIKALTQTIIGIFTFGGVSHNLPTALGISMSVTGGLSYIFAKYRESVSKKGVDLRKIMSFSTAEDLKVMKTANKTNGVVVVDIPAHVHQK